MRSLILLTMIFFSTQIPGQSTSEENRNETQFYFHFKHHDKTKRATPFQAKLQFQETVAVNYKRRRLNYFIMVENILNELSKPGPAINKDGFHYQANPFLEIEETKGNTGFIKLRMIINLLFK